MGHYHGRPHFINIGATCPPCPIGIDAHDCQHCKNLEVGSDRFRCRLLNSFTCCSFGTCTCDCPCTDYMSESCKIAEPIKNLRCNAVWGSGSMCQVCTNRHHLANMTEQSVLLLPLGLCYINFYRLVINLSKQYALMWQGQGFCSFYRATPC